MIGNIENTIVEGLLAVSTIIFIMDKTNILPGIVRRWLRKNEIDSILSTLEELGLDVSKTKRENIAKKIPEYASASTLEERISGVMNQNILRKRVTVGSTDAVGEDNFIDLMGATTDSAMATLLARDLVAFWRYLVENGRVKEINIEFICTPKAGSPLLGYEVAKILNLPFLLHNSQKKFVDSDGDMRGVFDFCKAPPAGCCGLLIDDSSTGGGKALKATDDLRAYGYEVHDMLVLFEPSTKKSRGSDARVRLSNKNIDLHSIKIM